MKKVLLYLAISLSLGSCLFEDTGILPVSHGTFSALQNSKEWGSRYPGGYKVINGGQFGPMPPCQAEYYSLIMDLYNSTPFLREDLNFGIRLHTPGAGVAGKFLISKFTNFCDTLSVFGHFYTISDDGDVLQDMFDVLETEENYLNIEKFDLKTLEIEGTFKVSFVVRDRSTVDTSTLPDTIRFTDGKFHTKIKK